MHSKVLSNCLCISLLLCALPVAADAATNTGAQSSNEPSNDEANHWTLSAGAQGTQEHAWQADGSISLLSSANTWSLDAYHGETSPEVYKVTSNGAALSYSRDGKHVGFSLGGRWFEDVDLLSAKELNSSLQFYGERWDIRFRGDYRKTDFDPFRANSVIRRRDGTLVPVSAMATCDLDNLGYGAEVGISSHTWRAYVGGMQYSYGNTNCNFDSPGLTILRSTNRQEFLQLANALTQRFSSLVISQLQNENSFLASEIDAGIRFIVRTTIISLEYQHAREQFQNLTSNTYAATFDFDVFKHSNIAVQLGTIDADVFGNTPFAGVRWTTRL